MSARRPLWLLLALGVVFAGALSAVLLIGRPPIQDGSGQQALGASLFRTRCASCHATTTQAGIGPGLAGLFAPGGPVLPPGVDYGGKLPNGQPITQESVAAFVRAGGQGQIGVMPGFNLTDQEIAALLGYLQTLER